MTYPGAEGPAPQDVSLTLAPGRVVGLAGGNGAGTSTLIHLLAGFQAPDGARVEGDSLLADASACGLAPVLDSLAQAGGTVVVLAACLSSTRRMRILSFEG